MLAAFVERYHYLLVSLVVLVPLHELATPVVAEVLVVRSTSSRSVAQCPPLQKKLTSALCNEFGLAAPAGHA